MLTIIGKLANAWQDVFGETDNDRTIARHKELQDQGMSYGEAAKRAMAERANGFHTRGRTVGDDAQALADKLSEAAKSWRSVTIDSLDTSTVDSWTDWATKGLTDLFSGDGEDPNKKPKGVSIGTAIIQVDLRNTDPDRMMVGLIEPIKKATKQPDSSSFDMGGF
jgi:hypothetical protein